VELSQPLWAAAGTRTFTFQRYRYMLDFSGFASLQRFEIVDIEFQCNGEASAVMLPVAGCTFRLADSVINRPRDRGVTSTGTGCQGIFVDRCQMLSNEQALDSQNRTTVALNINANDAKLRDNRVVRFAHFGILNGTGHIIMGNHFFQGDDATNGVRLAGIVFTQPNVASLVQGNYVDNCFLEWSNEHDEAPAFLNEFSFGGLTITGNIFTASNVAPWFRWLAVTPRGAGHFISGLSLTGAAFCTFNATIDRVEQRDHRPGGDGGYHVRHPELPEVPQCGLRVQHLQRRHPDHREPGDGGACPGHRRRYMDGERGRVPALRRAGAQRAAHRGRRPGHHGHGRAAVRHALCAGRTGRAVQPRGAALACAGAGRDAVTLRCDNAV